MLLSQQKLENELHLPPLLCYHKFWLVNGGVLGVLLMALRK